MLGDKMNIIKLEEVNSTNLYAKENLDSLEDKTVIIAKTQTCGRGRFDRKWIDLGEGNLFMTIVLKPSNSFDEVYSNLTQYLSVTLALVLEEYGLSPKIKWPNDVMVNGGKISGILSETVMQGNKFKGLVLGIGVNLNADKNDLKQIKERIPNTPIVLHGASTVIPELVNMCNEYGGNIPGAKGVPDEILHEASISGVSKINVDTDLRLAMTAGIRKVFVEDPSAFDPRKYLIPARELVKETVSHKMKDVFGSANKA